MPPPNDVELGPLSRALVARATWRERTEYPAHQCWADELEQLLCFLEAEGVLDQFMPRLSNNEWEGALAEVRTAFYFKRNGFKITDWQPRAKPEIPGDLEIQWRDTERIFVEVKGPGWESELSKEEFKAKRQFQPKYINAEARAIDAYRGVEYAIKKALPKFVDSRPNLVVVVDDFFFSPLEGPKVFLESRIPKILADANYAIVSAVFLLKSIKYSAKQDAEYLQYFCPNPRATHPLPEAVSVGLAAGNKTSE
ncbi:MAG TPA: hypothetical protein VH583_16890 [Vicinamibacterales bacterium]|jgi:hypothetical protein